MSSEVKAIVEYAMIPYTGDGLYQLAVFIHPADAQILDHVRFADMLSQYAQHILQNTQATCKCEHPYLYCHLCTCNSMEALYHMLGGAPIAPHVKVLHDRAPVVQYVASLRDEDTGRTFGAVTFSQPATGGPTTVSVKLAGLPPGRHGLHVHEYGDISGGCMSAGAHWNPDNTDHGGRSGVRHVGDLGNVNANSAGVVDEIFNVADMPLMGPRGILGRALVLHFDEDDLGLGSFADSKTTGHSGGRMACGVIGIAKLNM